MEAEAPVDLGDPRGVAALSDQGRPAIGHGFGQVRLHAQGRVEIGPGACEVVRRQPEHAAVDVGRGGLMRRQGFVLQGEGAFLHRLGAGGSVAGGAARGLGALSGKAVADDGHVGQGGAGREPRHGGGCEGDLAGGEHHGPA